MTFFETPMLTRNRAPGYEIMDAYVPGEVHEDFDQSLAAAVANKLHQHYPGHFWQTYADIKQGIVGVQIPLFMPETVFYVIKTADLASDPGMKAVVTAGGEILERWFIPRSSFERGLAETLRARDNHRLIGGKRGRTISR